MKTKKKKKVVQFTLRLNIISLHTQLDANHFIIGRVRINVQKISIRLRFSALKFNLCKHITHNTFIPIQRTVAWIWRMLICQLNNILKFHYFATSPWCIKIVICSGIFRENWTGLKWTVTMRDSMLKNTSNDSVKINFTLRKYRWLNLFSLSEKNLIFLKTQTSHEKKPGVNISM